MSSLSRSNIRRISPLREGESPQTGSNIPIAGAAQNFQRRKETLERGLMTAASRQMFSPAAAGGEPAAAPASAPVSAEQSRRNFYDNQRQTRMAQVSGTPAAAAAAAAGDTPALARPRPTAPAREGMIDGKPASQALAGMREEAAAGGPRQTFGTAKQDIETMGVQGAIASYFEKNRLDAERPQRAVVDEPGSMLERRQAEYASRNMGPPAVGPAQRALDESGTNVRYQAPDMGLARASAQAAGARTLRTPETPSLLDYRTSLRSPEAQAAVRGEVEPRRNTFAARGGASTSAAAGRRGAEENPLPRMAPVDAAPSLVRRTNQFADDLRARANTPYQQRMAEGNVSIDDMKKAVSGGAKNVAEIPGKLRSLSRRTNQWAENFRKTYAP